MNDYLNSKGFIHHGNICGTAFNLTLILIL